MRRVLKAIGRLIESGSAEARERAYLDQSTSLADVERRIREIDSGRFRGRMH